MILKVYGKIDAENLIKILANSGYDTELHRAYEEGPHKEAYIIEVIE